MMKKQFVAAVMIVCAAGLLFNCMSFAQTKSVKKDVTLHGELVDVISFVSWGSKQEADMVKGSANAGNPLGFYDTRAKKLYLVGVPDLKQTAKDRLLPFIGMRVFITGKVYTKGGVNVLVMSDVGKSIK